MKIISQLSIIFIIGGTLGWLNELIFRRIVHKKMGKSRIFNGAMSTLIWMWIIAIISN